MLHKETSKKWNAYKYALILPVIFLFLYSFNTVTKTEYVKSKVESVVHNNIDEPLIFDIISKTTQLDLNNFTEKINTYADFKIDLKMVFNANGDHVIEVYSSFSKKGMFKNFTMELKGEKPLLLEVSKEKARLNNTNTNETIVITEKGTSIESSDSKLLYDQGDDEVLNHNNSNRSGSIYITIPAKSHRKQLDEHKEYLKEDYNVDLDIKTLKYKDGKIVNIKLELDDNEGTVMEYAAKSDTGINTFCINGEVSKDDSNWSIGNCSSKKDLDERHSFNLNSKKGTLINTSSLPFKYSYYYQDSLGAKIKTLQSQLRELDDPTLWVELQERLKATQERLNLINSDTLDLLNKILKSKSHNFGNPNVRYSTGNATYAADTVHYDLNNIYAYEYTDQSDNPYSYSQNPPLVFVDGIEISEEEFRKFDNLRIASMNVLKDKASLSLYGDKGKNGVIIITTLTDDKYKTRKANAVKGTGKVKSSVQLASVHFTDNKTDDDHLVIYTPNDIRGLRGLTSDKNPFIIANDKKITETEFNNIDPQTVKLVNVLNGKSAIDKYGNDAKDGVIEIILKSASEMKMTEEELQDKIISKDRKTKNTRIGKKVSFVITIDEFNDAELNLLKNRLNKEGYKFEVKTFKKKGDKVTKLKFDIDGTSYTFEPRNGLKSEGVN